MPTATDLPLQQLAVFAAQHYIKGSSFKRNSLMKPLDIMLQELDKCAHPDDPNEIELLRAACKTEIFAHLERVAPDDRRPGRTKEEQVNQYVDVFFDGVLGRMHHHHVGKLLQRERLLRSAYLFWIRQTLSQQFAERGAKADLEEMDKNEQ